VNAARSADHAKPGCLFAELLRGKREGAANLTGSFFILPDPGLWMLPWTTAPSSAVTGGVNGDGEMANIMRIALAPVGCDPSGNFLFQGVLQPSSRSGLHGYTIRVLPRYINAASPFIPGLIAWAGGAPAGVPEMQLR